MALNKTDLIASPVITLGDDEAEVLQKRHEVLQPLASLLRVPKRETELAALQLSISERSVRNLLKRYRDQDGDPLAFVGKKAGRPVGLSRLSRDVEMVIHSMIERVYAKPQRPQVKWLHTTIAAECVKRGLKPPSVKAVTKRLRDYNPIYMRRRRHGRGAAEQLKPVVGQQRAAEYPLQYVEIDHTDVDVMLVDSETRETIGRPYITVAIDLFSRCIAGYYVSLEKPSTTSVGLAIVSMAEPKDALLESYGIQGSWPIAGKPHMLLSDNAAEFDSKSLRKGCARHGILIEHRPIARPHFGGTIERAIGSFMRMIHNELPGTTRSNVEDKGDYDAEAHACMTLPEFEGWLLKAICAYHAKRHSTLGISPMEKLLDGLAAGDFPRLAVDLRTYLIDFLPAVRRRIQRDGFKFNRISYYDPKLNDLIAEREEHPEGFYVRYDPRNLRFVWIELPKEGGYLEVAYRNRMRPDIRLWEWRRALDKARRDNAERCDEETVFQMAELRQQDVARSKSETRKARRDNERLRQGLKYTGSALPPEPVEERPKRKYGEVKPFSVEVSWVPKR